MEGWVDLGTAVNVQSVPKDAYRSDFHEKHRNFLTAAWFDPGTARAADKQTTASIFIVLDYSLHR